MRDAPWDAEDGLLAAGAGDAGAGDGAAALGLVGAASSGEPLASGYARVALLRQRYLQYAARMDATEAKMEHIMRRLSQARAERRHERERERERAPAVAPAFDLGLGLGLARAAPADGDGDDGDGDGEQELLEARGAARGLARAPGVSCGVQCAALLGSVATNTREAPRHARSQKAPPARGGVAAQPRCYSCKVANSLCALLLLFAAWEFYHIVFNG